MNIHVIPSKTTERFHVEVDFEGENYSCIIKHKRDRVGSNPPKTTLKWIQKIPKELISQREYILDQFFETHYPEWEKKQAARITGKYRIVNMLKKGKKYSELNSNAKIYSTEDDIL